MQLLHLTLDIGYAIRDEQRRNSEILVRLARFRIVVDGACDFVLFHQLQDLFPFDDVCRTEVSGSAHDHYVSAHEFAQITIMEIVIQPFCGNFAYLFVTGGKEDRKHDEFST